ncbi:unnamed protein product, partial [Prorocentrum cordatum]
MVEPPLQAPPSPAAAPAPLDPEPAAPASVEPALPGGAADRAPAASPPSWGWYWRSVEAAWAFYVGFFLILAAEEAGRLRGIRPTIETGAHTRHAACAFAEVLAERLRRSWALTCGWVYAELFADREGRPDRLLTKVLRTPSEPDEFPENLVGMCAFKAHIGDCRRMAVNFVLDRIFLLTSDGGIAHARIHGDRYPQECIRIAAGSDRIALLRRGGKFEVGALSDDARSISNLANLFNFTTFDTLAMLPVHVAANQINQISTSGKAVALLDDNGKAEEHAIAPFVLNCCRVSDCAQVAASGKHVALLKTNGSCVAMVLLRCDGTAVAYGANLHHECDIPPLGADVTYASVTADYGYTALLRSDGAVAVRGRDQVGGLILTPPSSTYTFVPPALPLLTPRAKFASRGVVFLSLSGAERCRFNLPLPDLAEIELCYLYRWSKRQRRSGGVGHGIGKVDAVLPNGRLLS